MSALNAGTAASSKAIVAPLRQSHPWIPFRITHPIVPGGHAAWPASAPLYLGGLDPVQCGYCAYSSAIARLTAASANGAITA